jgi:NAD(P)-dependent dehydrogenase (short-subunit alcohol dehydrogenase family)
MQMTNEKVENKVILITGAASGIGAATSRAFDAAGAKVAMADINSDKLSQTAAGLNNPLLLHVDLSDEIDAVEMVQKVINHFGRIDVLINNAASIIVSPAETVSSKDLLLAFKTNLVGPAAASQEAFRQMRIRNGGQIINVGSPGFMMGIPFYAPYVCSKAALSAWTRTIQAEWAGSGIIISEYFPGYVKTDSKPESRIGDIEQDFLMEKRQNFLTRLSTRPKTPEDVAKQLVKLVEKPKTLVYSDFTVQLGAFISNFSGFRLSIARQIAKTARKKTNRLF